MNGLELVVLLDLDLVEAHQATTLDKELSQQQVERAAVSVHGVVNDVQVDELGHLE